MRHAARRALLTSGAAALVGAVLWLGTRPSSPLPAPGPARVSDGAKGRTSDASVTNDDDKQTSFRIPTGAPASLSCADARRVIAQVREELAYEPERVRPAALAEGAVDWLDPHGLWSATPGSPVAKAIERRAPTLLRQLEEDRGECTAAREVGEELVRWVGGLRRTFDAQRALAATADPASASTMLFDTIGDGASSTQTPAAFAATLGLHVGVGERLLGPEGSVYTVTARERFLPSLDSESWSRAVLAALVRAYVPLVDPHGAWAPLDEESSVYEVDLDARPPVALWEKVARTALGARVESGALAPLRDGDVIVSLAGVPTAGLPMEQIDQLAIAVGDSRAPSDAVVLRPGELTPRALTLATASGETQGAGDDGLQVTRVQYDDGDVAVIAVHEVKDDLGEQMTRAVLREKARPGPRLVGFLIDLRGNGGGSTDGASATLGLFLPGATLFPLRRRDGSVETERAPEPARGAEWTGPVATLVDGNTASAAEMIAGALAAYRRGPILGRQTYGKGCAQEYQDDDAHAGVLRITTLLYALPDGTPVQRVGLSPTVRVALFPLPGEDTSGDTEAKLRGAPPTWRGPDVRDPQFIAKEPMSWPSSAAVGPCADADVCRALRAMNAPSASAAGSAGVSLGKVARVSANKK